MVNSGSFDSDEHNGDRNANASFIQSETVTASSQSSSPVTATIVSLCKTDCAHQTADSDLPSVAHAIEPTPTKTEFNSSMSVESYTTTTTLLERDLRLNADEEKASLCCSLPLDKVQGVLTTYQLNEEPLVKQVKQLSRKLLCLYCERTFVSANLRQKHVERCHSIKQNRRVSSRRHNSLTVTPCVFCDKLNIGEHTLKDLFQHLISEHSQQYFGCTLCEDRFLSHSLLVDHNASIHHNNSVQITPNQVVAPKKTKAPVSIVELSNDEEKEVPVKLTRSKLKLKSEEAEKEGKKPKAKKLSVKSTRIGIKRSKRLQAKTGEAPKAKRAKKFDAKQTTNLKAEPSHSTKSNEKNKLNCVNPYPEFDSNYRVKKITDHSIDNLKISSLTFDCVFDKEFFNRIKCNIQENLIHHIDGKLFKNEESESRISNFEKISTTPPDAVQQTNTEHYGCELSLNAVTPVASISLTSQFGEDIEAQIEYGAKPSKKKTQQSRQVHYKYCTRRKYQASILEHKENRDLSKLDMWTQLVIKKRQQKMLDDKKTAKEMLEYTSGEEYKNKIKRDELNRILDRRGPFEDLKAEASKKAALDKLNSSTGLNLSEKNYSDVREVMNDILNKVLTMVEQPFSNTNAMGNLCHVELTRIDEDIKEIPSYLNLCRSSSVPSEYEIDKSDKITLICSSQETENFELPTNKVRDKNEMVELTGEWARTRMYICAACGAKLPNMKKLLDHKGIHHQNVWVQHYEMVGNQSELYRHLCIPGLGKVGVVEDTVQCKTWKRSAARICTKCGKQCNLLGELHRHILECGGDWTWMLARKKCKYKPYGAKSRRKRRGLVKRTHQIPPQKIDTNSQKKTYKKAFDGPRQRPSDADTIERMLANLPAKRSTRKLISMQDGIYKSRKNPQNNITTTKMKCGKAMFRNSNSGATTNETTASNSSKKAHLVHGRALRSINKVLSSRILDTTASMLLKRKIKNNNLRVTRQNKLDKEVIEATPVKPVKPKETLIEPKEEVIKRTSPRLEKLAPEVNNSSKVKQLLTGKVNIKSFFPVKKKRGRKPAEETKIEPVEPKTSKFDSLVRTFSLKKKQTVPKAESSSSEAPQVTKKRKIKRSFRNVIKKMKNSKNEPETILQIDGSRPDSSEPFLEDKVEQVDAPVPDPIIVMNYTDSKEDPPIPETIFDLQSSNEKSLQAKGELDFDKPLVLPPIAVEIGSVKPSSVPLVSPKLKGKIRTTKGLNQCIAMLTSKLQSQKPEEIPVVKPVECILRIPTFKQTIQKPEVDEECALDLSTKHFPSVDQVIESVVDNNVVVEIPLKPVFEEIKIPLVKLPTNLDVTINFVACGGGERKIGSTRRVKSRKIIAPLDEAFVEPKVETAPQKFNLERKLGQSRVRTLVEKKGKTAPKIVEEVKEINIPTATVIPQSIYESTLDLTTEDEPALMEVKQVQISQPIISDSEDDIPLSVLVSSENSKDAIEETVEELEDTVSQVISEVSQESYLIDIAENAEKRKIKKTKRKGRPKKPPAIKIAPNVEEIRACVVEEVVDNKLILNNDNNLINDSIEVMDMEIDEITISGAIIETEVIINEEIKAVEESKVAADLEVANINANVIEIPLEKIDRPQINLSPKLKPLIEENPAASVYNFVEEDEIPAKSIEDLIICEEIKAVTKQKKRKKEINGEIKENNLTLKESRRNRTSKAKALENILDDALSELTESERNRDTIVETIVEIDDKTQNKIAPVIIAENPIVAIEEPVLEEVLDTQSEDGLRRSRRASRKITSYNENELVDPLPELEVGRKKPKKKVDLVVSEIAAAEKKLNSDELFDLLKASTDNAKSKETLEEEFTEAKAQFKAKIEEDKINANYCDICKKSFIRAENLVKHKGTLTHISKLSEIEAKEAEEKAKQQQKLLEIEEMTHDINLSNILQPIGSPSPILQSFSLNSANSNNTKASLKLADIINDVLNKPVVEENHFVEEPEFRPYKSLGERKSFDSENAVMNYDQSISKSTLEKQISLLENIIEHQSAANYIDDISISSNHSSELSMTSLKQDDSSNITFNKPVEESFVKPPQYEEISEDSANLRNYEDPKLRKTLNRDEELFLECCSLLKSGSEISNFSKVTNVINKMDLKQCDEPEWLERKSLAKTNFPDYSDDNSRVLTPLGDSCAEDASNSNTIASNWEMNGKVYDDEYPIEKEKSFSFEEVLQDEEKSSGWKNSVSKFGGMLSKTIQAVGKKMSKKKSDSDLHKKQDDLSDDSKKMLTKGALKVFEGVKVSIPTEELNLEEVLNCSPKSRNLKLLDSPSKRSARKSKPVKNKSQIGSKLLFKINKKKVTQKPEKKKRQNYGKSSQPDVYDFEETQDVFAKPDFKSFRDKKPEDDLETSDDTNSRDNLNAFATELNSTSSISSSQSNSSSLQKAKSATKKKCMIMGRIFKNVIKSKVDVEEIRDIPHIVNQELVENYVLNNCAAKVPPAKNKMSEKEMNLLFDSLLSENKHEVAATPKTRPSKKLKLKGRKRLRVSESTDDEYSLSKSTKKRSYRKTNKIEDNSINLEQELKECIGVASRKSQRKCTSGKQNVLVEYWSSDDSAFEALLESQKIETAPVTVPIAIEMEPETIIQLETKELVPKKHHKEKKSQVYRRKRAAANPLYHWSSSSEDEALDLIVVKPVRDEIDDDEDRPVQHGWIVGDSPKKLVTMLAQAKGKKIEVDCVKELGKKRSNAIS